MLVAKVADLELLNVSHLIKILKYDDTLISIGTTGYPGAALQ